MRIHSDTLTQSDFYVTLDAAGLPIGEVYIDDMMTHGSRSRDHAFEVHLGAFPGRDYNGKARLARNSGTFGAAHTKAATHDEWGLWIEQLFVRDPKAIVGPYKGLDDFRRYHGRKYVRKAVA